MIPRIISASLLLAIYLGGMAWIGSAQATELVIPIPDTSVLSVIPVHAYAIVGYFSIAIAVGLVLVPRTFRKKSLSATQQADIEFERVLLCFVSVLWVFSLIGFIGWIVFRYSFTRNLLLIVSVAVASICAIQIAQAQPLPRPKPPQETRAIEPVQSPGRTICGDRNELVSTLAKKFGEKPRVMAIQTGPRVLEIYVSPDGMWVAVLTAPGGYSCAVAAGVLWTEVEPAPVGEPA